MSNHAFHRLPAPLEAATQRIKQAVRQALERSIESLGLSALSATSSAVRSDILAAQFEIDRKSAMFILTFDEAFETRLRRDCGPRDPGNTGPSNWSELSLVEDHEVEIKVAAERFGLQLAHACEWELRELGGYLGAILTQERFDKDQNPLRPELIGLAMIRAAESVSEDAAVRKILVTEIGRSLAATLGPTYAAIVADFRSMGLQPAGMSVRMSESRGLDSRRSLSGIEQFGDSDHGSSRAAQDSALGAAGSVSRSMGGNPLGVVDAGMMNLIRRLAFFSASAGGGAGGAPGPQAGGFDDSGSGGGQPAQNLIRAHRDELRAASKGSIDHMVIDVIGSLFDQILSDPKVPPQMARQIARLQLPVLRAALGDPSFFSSRRHPVRRFVNRIASVGVGFDDFSDDRGQRFLAKVRELVQEIVQGDFEQIELYEAKLAALEAFVVEQAREEVQEVGDAVAVLQEKEDELRLQRMISLQLQADLKTLAGPEFLRQFIVEVWSQVLLRATLTLGAEHDKSRRFRQVGSELFMSVQPKASPQQRKAFLSDLPRLMQSLKEGMDLIRWPDAQRNHFFGQLLPAHAEALKNAGTRTLDYNLMARRVEGALERPLPSRSDLKSSPMVDLPVLSDEILSAPFNAEEARSVGLLPETAVDWSGKVDIDLSAQEPELSAGDVHIDGLPASSEVMEPTQGKSLADHVQIGFAYHMQLQGRWEKVRLSHVSTGRSFFVFTHGQKHRQTVSLTYRMLSRLCETGRLRAFESAYLLERATARARRQLAELGGALKAATSSPSRSG